MLAIKGAGGTVLHDLIFALAKAPSEPHYTALLGKIRLLLIFGLYLFRIREWFITFVAQI